MSQSSDRGNAPAPNQRPCSQSKTNLLDISASIHCHSALLYREDARLEKEKNSSGSNVEREIFIGFCDSDCDCYPCKQTLSVWIQRQSQSTCRLLHDESIHYLQTQHSNGYVLGQVICSLSSEQPKRDWGMCCDATRQRGVWAFVGWWTLCMAVQVRRLIDLNPKKQHRFYQLFFFFYFLNL